MTSRDFADVFMAGTTSIPLREPTPPLVQTLVPLHGHCLPPHPREAFEPWIPPLPSYEGDEAHWDGPYDAFPYIQEDFCADGLLLDQQSFLQEHPTPAASESSLSTPALTDGESLEGTDNTLPDTAIAKLSDALEWNWDDGDGDDGDGNSDDGDGEYRNPGTSSSRAKSSLVQRTQRKKRNDLSSREVVGSSGNKCPHCGISCACKSTLVRHLNTVHTRANTWSCKWCPKVVSRKDALRRHQERSCKDVPEGYDGPYPQRR